MDKKTQALWHKHLQQIRQNTANQRFKVNIDIPNISLFLEQELKARLNREYIKVSVIESAAKWLHEGNISLILVGVPGTGKTMLAQSIVSFLNFIGRSTNTVTAMDLSKMPDADREFYKDRPILYIDDLGVERLVSKEYGNDIYPLMEVISYRYRKTLPTIITTNLNEKQIIDRYGLRLQDRLDEQYDKIIYKNSSFRKLNNK